MEAETQEEAEERQRRYEQECREYEQERERKAEETRLEDEQREKEWEAERVRREKLQKARAATFDRILENAPTMFGAAQLKMFLRALINLDPYIFVDDVAEHLAGGDENNQMNAEEILTATVNGLADDKLIGFALRLVLTGNVSIPREGEADLLSEAETAFIPTKSKKTKVAKAPTPIQAAKKANSKKSSAKKQAAA